MYLKIIYMQFSLDHKMLLPSILYIMQLMQLQSLPTDGQTQMDQLWYEINVPFFLQEKAGIKCLLCENIFNI